VYFGNRNWHPLIGDTVRQMHQDGVRHFLTFVTSSFSCYSGCRQYRENIQQAIDTTASGEMTFHKIRVFFNHPAFVAMNVERIRDAMASIGSTSANTTLAFTAHSIPQAMADNCKYEAQLHEASSLVAAACGIEDWALVYQSRSGPPSMPWLEPDICDHIEALKNRGVHNLVIAPIGFLSDHMEVLFDLDTEAREACEAQGILMARAKTVGDHPDFAAMVCDLIEERALNRSERPTVGSMPPKHDVCPESCCLPPQRPRVGNASAARAG
jgi:ferrochelatase